MKGTYVRPLIGRGCTRHLFLPSDWPRVYKVPGVSLPTENKKQGKTTHSCFFSTAAGVQTEQMPRERERRVCGKVPTRSFQSRHVGEKIASQIHLRECVTLCVIHTVRTQVPVYYKRLNQPNTGSGVFPSRSIPSRPNQPRVLSNTVPGTASKH